MINNNKIIHDKLINYKYLNKNDIFKGISKLLNITYFAYNETITISSDFFVIDIENEKINLQFIKEEYNLIYKYTIKYLEYANKNKDYLLFYNFLRALMYKEICKIKSLKFLSNGLYYCKCLDLIKFNQKEREYEVNTAINIFTHLPLNTKIIRFEKGLINNKNFLIKNNKFFLENKEIKKLSILIKKGLKTKDILYFLL